MENSKVSKETLAIKPGTALTLPNGAGNHIDGAQPHTWEDRPSVAQPVATQNGVDVDQTGSSSDTNDDSDDNQESGLVWNEARKPRKISQKKQSESAGFETWVENNQENLAKRAPPAFQDNKSVSYLVKDWGDQKIITSPRDYQLELFERAKKQNTIAVLDTGSGKTLIAALLLRYVIEKELEDRAGGNPPKVAFFLVDKVALVFQQHAVLDCNLDFPMAKFCGDMVKSVWSQEFWEQQFTDNMIIVCTAEILYKCLHHSYIKMSQINLLIFDEAHHTKKGHPYARIIKDFYSSESNESRPRIFGMTASPVDAQTDVHMAAAELEGLLHSEIATASDPASLRKSVAMPKDGIKVYQQLTKPYDTKLTLQLKEIIGGNDLFSKNFTYSREAARELGPWCADRMWQLLFAEEELVRLEAKTERVFAKLLSESPDTDKYTEAVPLALKVINDHPFDHAAPAALSSKAKALLDLLKDCFKDPAENTRCIVFVERRWTAVMLADLFDQPYIRIPNVRVASLIGTRSDDNGSSRTSFREQLRTIIKFKRGEVNCVFATSIAEEGLDIPDCNVVIRFDLYKTMIQYIQSRGRARHLNSKYYHMIENNNMDHRRKVHQIEESEKTLRKFCSSLPEDRQLHGYDFNMEYFLRKERHQRQYTVPSTGAKLTFKQSLVTLANFVASLPHSDEVCLVPDYVIQSVDEGYICEVLMPSSSPITNVMGKAYSSKQVAKCSAAFETCLELLRKKYLDEHLRPIFAKQLPAMANARLAVSSKKKDEYDMRIKPDLWSQLGTPEVLFAAALVLSDPAAVGRASKPLLMLTRTPIPTIAPFQLFFGDGKSSVVHCVNLPAGIKIREGDLQAFTRFSLKVFDDIFSKEFEAGPENLPYFIVPTTCTHQEPFQETQDARAVIDWETLRHVEEKDSIAYTGSEPDDFFTEKFVADPFDGSRKFILRGVRKDMKSWDMVPDGVVEPGYRSWKDVTHNILNYSLSMWSKSRARVTLREDQPVVEAEIVSLRRNLLDEVASNETTKPRICYIVLEPLRISPLPMEVVSMAYNLPAIIHRMESNMIALDACRLLKLDIRSDLALEALTKDSDNSDEPGEEPVDFQPGMGSNYERLEFLGDCFLKMATTISIFTLIPDKNEFDYHVERMCLICNRNLFNHALEVQLQEYIRSKGFNRRTWYPEGLVLKRGKKTTEKNTHKLGDKTIADVCEAIIGAAYMTARASSDFDMAIQAVTRVTKHKNHPMERWSDYYAAYRAPAWQTAAPSAAQLDLAERIRETTGYAFRHPRLLRSAFRHPSYPRSFENLPSYQRLEFLGDALLDMAVVDHLFLAHPAQGPQWLTEHKMAIVSNRFLGCLAASLGFHRHMLSLDAALQKQVLAYVDELGQARADAEDDAERRGLPRADFARDYWLAVSPPPKCLADLVEAYVGAVFVDAGYDYRAVAAFFEAHVLPYFRDLRLYDAFARRHPVTACADLLAHRFRCRHWGMPSHELPPGPAAAAPGGPPRWAVGFMVHRQVVGHGVSDSTRYAKVAAAKAALAALQRMDLAEFRDKFKCDCVPDAAAGAEAPDVTEIATAI